MNYSVLNHEFNVNEPTIQCIQKKEAEICPLYMNVSESAKITSICVMKLWKNR